jgi:mycothiol synthase
VVDVDEISEQTGLVAVDGAAGRRWWARDVSAEAAADVAARARSLGLAEVRRLHQMRRPLPLEPELLAAVPDGLRPFRPGIDDEAWLRTNNRAFAWHPEQGGWTAGDLRAQVAEPWFEAEGFLLLDGDDGSIAAFCWTKHHAGADPRMGEVYVIGVDPDHQGEGLGRALTVAGLAWQWEHHEPPVGMLYVEHDNVAAVGLYRRLGFEVHSDDVAYAVASTAQHDDG